VVGMLPWEANTRRRRLALGHGARGAAVRTADLPKAEDTDPASGTQGTHTGTWPSMNNVVSVWMKSKFPRYAPVMILIGPLDAEGPVGYPSTSSDQGLCYTVRTGDRDCQTGAVNCDRETRSDQTCYLVQRCRGDTRPPEGVWKRVEDPQRWRLLPAPLEMLNRCCVSIIHSELYPPHIAARRSLNTSRLFLTVIELGFHRLLGSYHGRTYVSSTCSAR
jgi:hypothetical protein